MHIAGTEAETGPILDFERALAPSGPEQSAAPGRRPDLSLGLLLSLAFHLSPLLLLLPWRAAPVEVPPPIPVQLVIEQPPPPRPEPVAPADTSPKPPLGRLASEEVGEKADPNEPAVTPPSDTQPETDSDQQAKPSRCRSKRRISSSRNPSRPNPPTRPVRGRSRSLDKRRASRRGNMSPPFWIERH